MGAGDGVRRRDGSRGGNGGMTRPPMVLGRRSSGSCARSDVCPSVAVIWDGDKRRDSAGGLPASSLVTEGKDVWSLEDAPRGGGEAPRGRYGRGGPFVKNISSASLSDSWKYPLRVGQSVLRSGSVRGKMSQERWLTRRYLKLQAAGGWPPCQLGESQRCPDLSVFTYCEWTTWWVYYAGAEQFVRSAAERKRFESTTSTLTSKQSVNISYVSK